MGLARTEQFLSGSGLVSIRYFLTPSEKRPYLEVPVVRYSGAYSFGSGEDEARYKHAMAKAAVAFRQGDVVRDFPDCGTSGATCWRWCSVSARSGSRGPSPVAIVVGPGCEEVIRTLRHGERSSEPLDRLGWAFRDQPSAWRYVAGRIG